MGRHWSGRVLRGSRVQGGPGARRNKTGALSVIKLPKTPNDKLLGELTIKGKKNEVAQASLFVATDCHSGLIRNLVIDIGLCQGS